MLPSQKNKLLLLQEPAMQLPRVTLNPGDFRFYTPTSGSTPVRLYTLLGSCVSVVLWHPERRAGGMSHGLLPKRGIQKSASELDGRYCDEAIAMFKRELLRSNTHARQYHAYMLGGGDMFQLNSNKRLIGDQNVQQTRICLKEAGFILRAEHVQGEAYRTVELDLSTGAVQLTVNKNRILLP